MNPEVYLSKNYLTLDLETTNLQYGSAQEKDNKLLMSVHKLPGHQPELCVQNEYKQLRLILQCEVVDFIVAHNAKFELKWLQRMGLDISEVLVWDTMIAEFVLHGNTRVPLDLGSVAQRYGYPGKDPYVDICIKSGVCPSQLPEVLLARRCMYDVHVTEGIFRKQLRLLQEQGKLGCMLTRCILTPVLADIEQNGMFLDNDRVQDEYYKVLQELEKVTKELNELTGGINYNSPKQKAELLYNTLGFSELRTRGGQILRTDKGNPKTDVPTMISLKARTKIQKKFIQLMQRWSHLDTAMNSLAKFKACCDSNDTLYAEFNQCIARTHRLTSSGTKYKIQFQNMAREYKGLIKARNKDWLIGEPDGSQLEFRVAAFLGQDTQAIHDIRTGVDVHSYTAEVITNAGQPTSRQEAKSRTFKPLYGGSSGTDAEREYYDAFKKKYSGIAETQQTWIDEVLATKTLTTVTGLEFHWPGTKMSRDGYVSNTTAICNYPVQSLATADIIPIALYYFWRELKRRDLRSFIVNTVHDSVILEVHPDEILEIREISLDTFTEKVYTYLKDVYNITFNVPLGVGIKFGEHWSEGEEEKINVEPR